MKREEEYLVRVMAGQAHLYAGLHCEADYRAVGAAVAEIDRLRANNDVLAELVRRIFSGEDITNLSHLSDEWYAAATKALADRESHTEKR